MHRVSWKTSAELCKLYRTKQISQSEVATTSLLAAKHIQDLNAFISIIEPSPSSKHEGTRLLEGVPMAVKDNFCTKDVATTCGSKMLQNYVPPFSATVVDKARSAGAMIVGKTNLDEFAMGSGGTDSIFGPTKSVWRSGISYHLVDNDGKKVHEDVPTSQIGQDDWVIAGGSSSGSAVAVASGVCLAALGSDTGGSVRIPGAWNGIPTLKPTYGALSRHGLIPLCNSLDVPGLMARSVEDLANLYNALKGHDVMDSTTVSDSKLPQISIQPEYDLSTLTVGIPLEYHCQDMSDEVIQSWSEVADFFQDQGAKVKQVSLPHTPYSILCYAALNPCEVASNMARYDGLEYGFRDEVMTSTEDLFASCRRQGFNYVVRSRILAGNYFLLRENVENYFIKSLKMRRLVARDFAQVWSQGIDILLTPVTLSDAPSHSDFSQLDNRTQTSKQDYCTQPVNLAGLSAATVPVKLSRRGLPLSLQVIGPRFSDHLVLNVCKQIESHVRFPFLVLD